MEKSSAEQKDCICDGPSSQPCGPGCKRPYTDEPDAQCEIVEVLGGGDVIIDWARMLEGQHYSFSYKKRGFFAVRNGRYLEICKEY
mgnify:CR=1 FL=1